MFWQTILVSGGVSVPSLVLVYTLISVLSSVFLYEGRASSNPQHLTSYILFLLISTPHCTIAMGSVKLLQHSTVMQFFWCINLAYASVVSGIQRRDTTPPPNAFSNVSSILQVQS